VSVLFLRQLRWRPLLLEADAAEHRPALRRPEGNRRLLAALRAVDARLRAYPGAAAHTLGLAHFAVLGVVLELFIVEEQLLTRSKNKLGAAIAALQDSVYKFHGRLPQRKE